MQAIAAGLTSGSAVLNPDEVAALQVQPATHIFAPAECRQHLTAPEPIRRGGPPPPPENVNRIHVLTDPDVGVLRAGEFADLPWDGASPHVPLADVLRVHDWPYVRKLQAAAGALPGSGPGAIGHLDGDTAISQGSFGAALAAAGAVCRAVDAVVGGQARNAFCAVRPPGHHAGPVGVVTCANDPHGSHGFCLLNNIAIAAAYAVNVYRHQGIRRVALLDFDVHHGNGTEACVGGVVPGVSRHAFKTPFSEGVQSFPVWRPWLDAADAENILFASVQGYGPKHPSIDAFVYPGSGGTSDSQPPAAAPAGAAAAAAAEANAAAVPPAAAAAAATVPEDADAVEEDPDGEFGASVSSTATPNGPRVINVGVPGPGPQVALWRRAWRDKILPAVVRFQPDLIFISAGFDAHRKDDLNYRYIGIAEKEYEWVTDQIVQVANRCCAGRIVSALEGGYRIQGGPVSAFARSVAAHVRALAAAARHTQAWHPANSRVERAKEKERAAAVEARRAAAAAEAASQPPPAAADVSASAADEAAAAAHSVAVAAGLPATEAAALTQSAAAAADAVLSSAAAAVADGGGGPSAKRRRRGGGVDYVALNAQLEAEAASTPGTAASAAAAVPALKI